MPIAKSPRKLAPWATAFKDQHARLHKPASDHKAARLDLAKELRSLKRKLPAKNRFVLPMSKEAYQMQTARSTKTVRYSRIRSRRPERAKQDKDYNERVVTFLQEPQNLFCWCCIARNLKAKRSTNVHHKHGRGWRGELQMVEALWIPCCSTCHPAWIDSHREEARAIGMLAPAGQWNKMPPETP